MKTATRSPADWMDMTLSDWLDVTPSELMERTMPGWREGYDDVLRTTPRDWLMSMYTPFATQTPWPMMQPLRRRRRHDWRCGCDDDREHGERRRHKRGCRHCGRDACECYCCIGDVDVVVYARVGERRVVPITVENERRREREIKLELSSWTTRGGRTGLVETVAVHPKEFTVAPCGEQDVVLVIEVRGQPKPDDGGDDGGNEGDDLESRAVVVRGRVPDVDTCEVVTADLRLVGCDHRSLRLATAVLPRDCDPFVVSCGCTCC